MFQKKPRFLIFLRYYPDGYHSFSFFLSYRCILSLVETFLYGLKKRLKVLIFFFISICNVKKKTVCMEAKERYIQSEVMVSKMYVSF